MNNRLKQFLGAENISQSQFADTINMARASVSHILAGRNKPGWDFLNNMIRHYPNLNIEWLLTGTGKMYKNQYEMPKPPSNKVVEQIPADLFTDFTSSKEKMDTRSDGADASPQPALSSIPGMPVDRKSNLQDSIQSRIPDAASQESRTHEPGTMPGSDSMSQKPSDSPVEPIQHSDIQRKISKIVVFYDDNTFIEIK